MKKVYKSILAATIALSTTMSIVTGFAANNDKEKNQENNSAITYNAGNEIKPDVQVLSDNGTQLTKGVDYDLSYENNVNVGKATVNITFKGNYTGTRTSSFDIIPDVLNQEKVSISETTAQTYTGSAITPTPTIKYGDVTLVKDKDYNLTYTDNVNVGKAKINVSFIGNYSGSATTNFDIIPDVLNQEKVDISEIAKQTYTGKEITPTPTIKYGDVTLVKDKDYTLTYTDNINVGTAKVSITFIGNYSGTAATNFDIIARVVTEDDKTVTIQPIADQTYTGSEITPEPVIIDKSR